MSLIEFSVKKSVQAWCTPSQPITWNPCDRRNSRSLVLPHNGTKNLHSSGLDFPAACSKIDQYFSNLGLMLSLCQGKIPFSQRSFQPSIFFNLTGSISDIFVHTHCNLRKVDEVASSN